MRNPAPLLDAVCADPDDLLPRLAYADWLEENGGEAERERAELVRVEIALGDADEDDPATWPARAREKELRKRLNPRLKDAVRAGRDAVYRNGFIEGLTLTVEEFLKQAPAIFARTPLRQVRFWPDRARQNEDQLPALLASEHLARLRRIELALHLESPEMLRRIADCPYLAGLEELAIPYANIRAEGAAALASSPLLGHLRVFELPSCGSGDEAVAALAEAVTGRLRVLNLAGNGLTAVGLRSLAGSPNLTGLREMDLQYNQLGAEGLAELVASPAIAGLERLHLSGTGIGAAEVAAFMGGKGPGRLRRLILTGNRFADRHEFWRRSYPPVGDEGAAALAASPWLGGLRVLHLSQQGIGPAGTQALSRSRYLAGLHTLGLGQCPLGDEGARAIAGSPRMAGLRSLRLRDCGIGSTGAKVLAESPHLGPLALLELRDNPIRAAGLRALRARFSAALRMERGD
jgi:uncharacterized protein (TIGR02996 family)